MKILSSFNGATSRQKMIEMAGYFPADDGPGSYDQPKRNQRILLLYYTQNEGKKQ